MGEVVTLQALKETPLRNKGQNGNVKIAAPVAQQDRASVS